jgi:hypothetical protein
MCRSASASAASTVRLGVHCWVSLYPYHHSFDNMPTTPKARKPRPQSARLDILSMMMSSDRNMHRPSSPTDSLSPCREDFAHYRNKIPRSNGEEQDIDTGSTSDDSTCTLTTTTTAPDGDGDDDGDGGGDGDDDDWFESEQALPPLPLSGKSQTHETCTAPSVQTTTTTTTTTTTAKNVSAQQLQPLSLHVLTWKSSVASLRCSLPATSEPRCLLSRPHRPTTITVTEPNGASTLCAYELKQAIQKTRLTTDSLQPLARTLPLCLPERGRSCHRRSPAQQIDFSAGIMGNQHSHHDSGDEGVFDADDRSTPSARRVSRLKAARLPRRSSMNVFKRLDSKSPLPADLTGAIIEVPRAATAPNLDGMADEDETEDREQERRRARHAHHHSAPSPTIPTHPASPTETLTEESAGRALSPSDTITDRQASSQEDEDSPAHLRVSALSPTLPAPSPIPEDSPHKYGLRDRMDTPEANSPPPPDAELAKARRRSSGLAIFNVRLRFSVQISIRRKD